MFSSTWTHIKTPKPADKEGGIWVHRDDKRCGHNPFSNYNVCTKPILKQEWLFVKSVRGLGLSSQSLTF
jgi:hypothetical protein